MSHLNVYLKKVWYDEYKNGKRYELWCLGETFNPDSVYNGRDVKIRQGSSGRMFSGIIGKVLVGTLDNILDKVDYRLFAPSIGSLDEARREARELLKCNERYIAFEVIN